MNRMSVKHMNQLVTLVRVGTLRLTDVLPTTTKPVPVYCVIKGFYKHKIG